VGVRLRCADHAVRGRHAVRGTLPERAAVDDRPRVQPHDRERIEHRVHAADHDLDGPGRSAARASVPGVDVLDLPQARHPGADRRSCYSRVKPVDPRLWKYAGAARGFFVLAALIGVLQTAVVIAFAWFLTDAVTGALAGRSVLSSLGWMLGLAVLRGALIAASDFAGMRAAAATG